MNKIKENKLTPKTATTFNKVLKLKRDNVNTSKSWFMVDGNATITICNQKNGEKSTGVVILTYREFERFIKFYETGK